MRVMWGVSHTVSICERLFMYTDEFLSRGGPFPARRAADELIFQGVETPLKHESRRFQTQARSDGSPRLLSRLWSTFAALVSSLLR